MAQPKLSKLELQIMDALWTRGTASIREIQEAFPERDRPAYTTIQTTVYRLEAKKALRRVKKIGNFHVFEAAVSRTFIPSANRRSSPGVCTVVFLPTALSPRSLLTEKPSL